MKLKFMALVCHIKIDRLGLIQSKCVLMGGYIELIQ